MKPTRARPARRSLPALHPIGLAALVALCGPAWALPQGGTVVSGQVRIGKPSGNVQVVQQGSAKAIIDWTSFSIASGETVRFDQPSSSAVLLNRVTGYDPSEIFGQLQSNGQIFLLNPYGVVFGSGARIDVGGMVASSLSLSNADFLAGRYALNSNDGVAPAQRGAVRNEGTINAPGGIVVLAAPNVSNTGSIDATGGRVGMAAAQEVLVDVEGDSLLYFRTSATEAGNRLAQLGRIQADGGSVELRAAARGSFADTVLNMGGVVQARSLGLREGKVVIDGGEAGITRVAGTVDVSGADGGGGRIEVTGQKVLLDDGARLAASGTTGGGTVLVGGDWQGQGLLRNAEQTHVAAGASIDVSATAQGSAGKAVFWSDDATRFYGQVAARGGAQGGDGGRVEVSGKQYLDFNGTVDARAAAGRTGSLLLDPSNITISSGTNSGMSPSAPFVGSSDNSTLNVTTLVGAVNAADVTVDATGGTGNASTPTISVTTPIAWNSTHSLTLKATGTIDIGAAAAISNGSTGGLNLFTNGAVNVGSTVTLTGGSFTVAGTSGGATRAASYTGVDITTSGAATKAGGTVTISTIGNLSTGAITTRGGGAGGAGTAGGGGNVTLRVTDGTITTGAIDTRGGSGGNVATGPFGGGAGGTVDIAIDGAASTGQINLGAVTAGGGSGSTALGGDNDGGNGAGAGTVTIAATLGNVAAASIDASGGAGGVGHGNGNDGNGGAAGAVGVASTGGAVTVGRVGTLGGAAGGVGATAGARANITLSAGTDLSPTGNLVANTGTGSSTIDLKFGQADNGGTLDLTGAGTIGGNTLKATGGASSTGDRIVAVSDATTTTLNDTTLQFSGGNTFTLAAVDAADLSGGAGNNTLNAASWSGTLTVRTSGGTTDVVHGNGAKTTLVGGNGGSTFNISTANTGSVGNTSFDGVGNLAGGSGNDSFVFAAAGSLSGSVTGGGGADTLNLGAKAGAIAIDLATSTASGIGGTFSGIGTVIGNDSGATANTTLTTSNAAGLTISISGANAGAAGGVSFQGVGNVTGGSGGNTVQLAAGGSLTGNLVGSGSDTLDLSARAGAVAVNLGTSTATGIGGTFNGFTTFIGNDGGATANSTLTGSNTAGQTITISGANTGTAGGLNFQDFGNLAGGSGGNTFRLAVGGSLSGNLAGGAAGDTLDLSARSGAVAVNLETSKATGIGGTFSGITTLVGNDGTTGSNTTLTGSNAGLAFTLNGSNAGTAGSLAFSGVGNLAGGSGADSYTGAGGSLAGNLTDSGGTSTLAGTLTAAGGQSYAGAVTLGADTTLASSGTIRLASTVDGNQALVINTAGLTRFDGAVGATTALASLSTDAAGTTTINAPSVRTNGSQTYLDAVSAGTLTLSSLNAGGNISAANAGNDFGTLSLATTGATDVTIRDANALTLGIIALGSGSNSFVAGTSLARGTTPTAGSTPSLTVGGVAVNATVSDYFMTGAASTVQIDAGAAGTHDLSATGASVLPTLTVTGKLTVDAGGAISQTGALDVTGITQINGGANTITLTDGGNQLRGAVRLNNSGLNAVQLVNGRATQLDTSSLGSGPLSITSTGPITQNGAITQAGAGAVSLDAGANTITLGNTGNDFAGPVTLLGSSATIADQNGIALAGTTLASLGVTANGAITQTGVLTVTGSSSFDAGNGSIALGAANSLGGPVTLASSGAGSVALTNSGALQIAGATLGSGTLALSAGGPITQTGAITQSGAGTVTIGAGGNAVTLTNGGNNFVGAVGVTGGAVQLTDQNALALGPSNLGSLGVVANGAVTQSGAVGVTGNTSIDAGTGSITLTNAGNSFGGTVSLNNSGANNVALTSSGALQLAGSTLGSGTLSLTAAGAVTQTAALTQSGAGAVAISAGANAVTLDQPGNDFRGPVSVSNSGANAVTLRDTNALPLGTLTLGSGPLTLTAAGDITQTGPITTAGTANINAGSGNVVLANAGNDFQSSVTVNGAAISVRDANDLSVTATPALNSSLSLVAGGTLNLPAGNIDTGTADLTLSSGTGLGVAGTLAGTNLTLGGGTGGIALLNNVTARGSLTLQTSNAGIVQFGGNLDVTGSTSITAGAAGVSLGSAGNDFRGPVSVSNSGANAVTLRDTNALPLGTLTLGSGPLTITAAGDITQTGPITTAGTANINAGTGNVVLANAGNDFQSSVTVNGAAISVRDATDLNVTATPALNSSLSLVAGGTLNLPAGNIDTGTADLTLSSGTGLVTAGTLAGTNLTLGGGTGGIALLNNVTARGSLTLQTSNAGIVQFGGNLDVAGSTSITAGAAGISLGSAGNDFRGPVSVSNSGANAVTLVDANALPLGTLALGSGPLTVVAAGDVTQTGPITTTGAATINAGTGNVVLANAGNDFASVAVNGAAVSLRDSNALTLGAVTANSLAVTTASGAVSQTAAATVTGATTVNAGNATVTLAQAGNRFGRIGVTGGAVTLVNGAPLLLDATTATSLSVTSTGTITQAAPLHVGGATLLNAGAGDITLADAGNDFGSVSLSGGALTIADANDLTITSFTAAANRGVSFSAGGTLSLPLGNIDTGTADLTLASGSGVLTTRGAVAGRAVNLAGGAGITLGGNVTSSTDQTYATAVTLATDATLNAGAGRIALQSGLGGGGHALGLVSSAAGDDAIRTGGAIANVTQLTASGNTTLGGNVTTSGNQSYAGRLTLATNAALDAGAGRIALQGDVNGGSHDLSLASSNAAADAIRSGGNLAGLGRFTATGHTTLGGSVTGSGDQTYAGTLALANDATLDAGGGRIAQQGAVDGGGHRLTLSSTAAAADAIRTGSAIANTATLSAGGNTTLGGSVTTTGDQTYAGTVALAADTTLSAGAGKLLLQGAVDGGGRQLVLASTAAAADAIRTGSTIANAASLDAQGNIALGGSVTTGGAQDYRAAVRLDADATLSGTSLHFASTVDGAQALTLRSADTRFAAAVGGGTALASLDVGGAGSTRIGGNVTTTGTQTWGNAVTLGGDSTISGSTLRFASTIDGAQALNLAGGGATTFLEGAVGQTTALNSLSIVGPATLSGGTITTTGTQSYAGALTLAADTTLAGSALIVNSSIDGAHALSLQFPGFSTLGGAIGAATPLTSLTASGPIGLLGSSITTSGAQSFDSTLQLTGDTQLHGSSLTFVGAVSGARDLLLDTDTLNATSIAGTGTLTISPRSAGRTIGVAGGAGDLQVTQSLIDSASGFAQQVIGRADGSGDLTVGSLRLASSTTLQSGSGTLNLAGSVDGAFDLALNTGGTTRIAGPIGATTALRSLSTDNQAAAADWNGSSGERTLFDTADGTGAARVITTGAQTYADPVVSTVPLNLSGGAITADQAANHFAGAIAATASSLTLRSAGGIVLGNITLANGGRIETDGVLQLNGALQLNGGTLQLVSNATPTAQGFSDPDLQGGDPLTFGFTPLHEASATIVQNDGATLASSAGSLLVLRSPGSGSILLDKAGNTLLGEISAVSGPLGDNSATRFSGNDVVLGFVRIASSEIHAAGSPPAAGSPDPLRAGIEGDVLKLTADKLTTGPDGLLRARLPYLESQGSQTSLPGLTLVMSPQALAIGGGFGTPTPSGYIQVRVGNALGGYLTVRPKGVSGENAIILLAGPDPKPFYDGAGKLTEVRVFYNGDAPRTPQETGALTAVTAIVEDARHARFEEAVRTENVTSRLRSGVIAEVGSGRPATVGRESIRLPQNCSVKPNSLQCE